MKLLLFAFLILFVACTMPVIRDTRTDAQRASTATARASEPYSANEGVLRVRLVKPPVTIEPQVAVPDWSYTVTPTPEVSE